MHTIQTSIIRILSVITGSGTVKRRFSFVQGVAVAFVVLCMAVNMLAPVAGMNADGNGLIARLLNGLSPAVRLNAVCGLPVTAVSGMIGTSNPLADAYAPLPADESGQRGTCGYVTARPDAGKKLVVTRFWTGDSFVAAAGATGTSLPASHWPPGSGGLICIMLLSYLVILMRSNLPWETVLIRAEKRPGLK